MIQNPDDLWSRIRKEIEMEDTVGPTFKVVRKGTKKKELVNDDDTTLTGRQEREKIANRFPPGNSEKYRFTFTIQLNLPLVRNLEILDTMIISCVRMKKYLCEHENHVPMYSLRKAMH